MIESGCFYKDNKRIQKIKRKYTKAAIYRKGKPYKYLSRYRPVTTAKNYW
jgi:hypothetical protein